MTKTIEFDDIRVGDRIRVTFTKIVYDGSDTRSTLLVWEIAVTAVSHEFVDSFAYCFSRDEAKRYTFELLERAPKVFKVGDKVDVLDFELLPQGTILVDKDEAIGTPRFVDAGRKKIIIDSTDMFPFSFYLESRNVGYNFVVAYTPGGEK